MPRVFFAIPLHAEIKESLRELQRRFTGENDAVKWVKHQNFHLTLHFLGDVAEYKLESILNDAQKVVDSSPAFTIDIRTTGVFPHHRRPRVIWVGITQGHSQLTQLAETLANCLDIPLDKPFSPHITLGRVREGRASNLDQFLQKEAEYNGGSMVVDRFACVQSTLTPQGPVYDTIQEYALSEKK